MFFYSEPSQIVIIPLTLLANTSSLYLADACVGTSSQIAFTISSSGNTTEIVTLSDNSDQFSFSPSSFILTGSITSQIITVTFTPTKPWGLKSGSLTLSASGGSILTVAMSGNAVAIPLILTSSVNSITFNNTTVGSSNSRTFTVSAGGFSSVEEIVTVSDDSNQFNFSPSTFALTGSGVSRTVTASFVPTSIGVKTGNLTLSSSGGSTKIVTLQGTALEQYYDSTLLLIKGDGANNSTSIIDSSINNITLSTVGNARISTAQSKYGGSSIYFDGIGDYIYASTNPVYDFGTGDFTIEAWVNLAADNISYQNVASLSWNAGTAKALQIRYGDAGFGYKLQVTIQSITAPSVWSCALTQTSHKNKWSHVAFTRSSGVCRLFVDGVLQNINSGVNPSTYPSTSFTDNSNVIGNSGIYFGNNSFTGYLDDIRVTKGIARYTSNFTPPGAL